MEKQGWVEVVPRQPVSALGKYSRSILQMLSQDSGQSDSPSLTKGVCAGREACGSCLGKGGTISLMSSTLSMPEGVCNVFPTFTQSSPKPQEVGTLMTTL